MKHYYLSIILLFAGSIGVAQTNTFPLTGNVGIGTTTPGAKLSFDNLNSGTDEPDGITWFNPSPLAYGIHRTAGSWVPPNFQQLKLSWDTGIILDPGTEYGKSYVDVQGAGLRVSSGNVGIGDTDPQFMLTLKRSSTNGDAIGIFKSDESPNLDFYSAYNGTSDIQSGSFGYGVRPSDDAWQVWERGNNLQWTTLFTIKKDGNIGIGTSDTKGYKLAIAGNMIAESVKVKLQNTWPDYVFAKEYQFPTLQETEKHIKERGHLPGIPSAAEVKSNGIDLGEMNAKLLQKIEELTLYLIEMRKNNEKLENRVMQLEFKNQK